MEKKKGKKSEDVKKSENACCSTSPCGDKRTIGIIILILILGAFFVYSEKLGNSAGNEKFAEAITQEEAKGKVKDFVEGNLVQPGTSVEIKEISDESGLYKAVLNVSGQEIVSYLTKDGKQFFPQVMDIAEVEASKKGADAEAAKEAPKSDKPVVDLFVMSYCPYGTQIEKGIIPAAKALEGKIDFNLKFVDYIMHGKKESDENLLQYCIDQKEPSKLLTYLDCFLKEGEGTESACLRSSGINAAAIKSCVSATDTQYKVTEKFNDKTAWNNSSYPPFDVHGEDNKKYGVQGSPTLVINGETVSSARDPKSLLATICSAFNEQPEECGADLSSAAPTPGFGSGTSDAPSADASCE